MLQDFAQPSVIQKYESSVDSLINDTLAYKAPANQSSARYYNEMMSLNNYDINARNQRHEPNLDYLNSLEHHSVGLKQNLAQPRDNYSYQGNTPVGGGDEVVFGKDSPHKDVSSKKYFNNKENRFHHQNSEQLKSFLNEEGIQSRASMRSKRQLANLPSQPAGINITPNGPKKDEMSDFMKMPEKTVNIRNSQ